MAPSEKSTWLNHWNTKQDNGRLMIIAPRNRSEKTERFLRVVFSCYSGAVFVVLLLKFLHSKGDDLDALILFGGSQLVLAVGTVVGAVFSRHNTGGTLEFDRRAQTIRHNGWYKVGRLSDVAKVVVQPSPSAGRSDGEIVFVVLKDGTSLGFGRDRTDSRTMREFAADLATFLDCPLDSESELLATAV